MAGRSNALSGMVDANVDRAGDRLPALLRPFGGADLYSSLRMPSGVAPGGRAGAGRSRPAGSQDPGAERSRAAPSGSPTRSRQCASQQIIEDDARLHTAD